MRLYSVLVYNLTDYILVYKNFNLSDFYFFSHNKIKSGIIEIADQIIKNINTEKFYQITETFEEMTFYIYICTHNDKVYITLTDSEYPSYVALEFIQKLYNLIDKNNISEDILQPLWNKYQNPTQISKLIMVKEDLNETKKVMMETIDKIIERGDKIEDLITKTENLQTNADVFRIQAKKLNSCCWIL